VTVIAPGAVRPAIRRRSRVRTCWRWELAKLAAQARVRYTLLACVLAPFLFVFLLNRSGQLPKDQLYGRWVRDSGFAIPLLLLGFAGLWVFPLLTSLVAGDIFAAEDQHGTWKTVLTRSQSRAAIFWGKTLAAASFALALVVLLALSCLLAGVTLVNASPLESVSGTLLPAGRSARVDLGAWACMVLPLWGFTALGLLVSVLARNAAVGVMAPVVVGGIMQLYAFLNGSDGVRRLMLTSAFDSWHGLAATHPYYGALWRGVLVSLGWITVCLTAAWIAFRRRDVTGG
jgi:ABC-2 type transport system permease protein